MFDDERNKYVRLESKVYIKYLGVLIDQNLSWKYHIIYIDSIVTKISKNVGLIAKLRHSVPRPILFNIYKSLIHPYLTYGLALLSAWGQVCKTYLNKILILQKRALCLLQFDALTHLVIRVSSAFIFQTFAEVCYSVFVNRSSFKSVLNFRKAYILRVC